MLNFGKFAILLATTALFISCAHHPDVRPGANNTHSVIVTSTSVEEGSRNAIYQARSFCKASKQQPQILEESSKYVGDMDEDTYKRMKTASKVTKALGGSYGTPDVDIHTDNRNDMTKASDALNAASGKGYSVTLKFSCI